MSEKFAPQSVDNNSNKYRNLLIVVLLCNIGCASSSAVSRQPKINSNLNPPAVKPSKEPCPDPDDVKNCHKEGESDKAKPSVPKGNWPKNSPFKPDTHKKKKPKIRYADLKKPFSFERNCGKIQI